MQADFNYDPVRDAAGCQLSVTVLADRDHIRAEMREDALAAGFSIRECCSLEEYAQGPLAALGDLVLVDCAEASADAMALLSRLDMRGGKAGAQLVVSTTMPALDSVFGCFSMSAPQILVDPGRASTNYDSSKRQFEILIAERGFPDHARAMFANMFFDPTYNELRDRLAERGAGVPADVATLTYLAMLDWDANRCEAAFDAVRVPVLVIQSTTRNPGEDRRPLKPGEMSPYQKMIVERINGAESESFPGLGHFTMIEAAGDVNARVARFVEERVTP